MKDQDIIKAIAELDGYIKHRLYSEKWPAYVPKDYDEGFSPTGQIKFMKESGYSGDFHYYTSYDAIVPVIQKQSTETMEKFLDSTFDLFKEKYEKKWGAVANIALLSPPELCKALLYATGRWIL